jgi:hypothetical protein
MNIHAPTGDIFDVKDSFYDELECVFDLGSIKSLVVAQLVAS